MDREQIILQGVATYSVENLGKWTFRKLPSAEYTSISKSLLATAAWMASQQLSHSHHRPFTKSSVP
jgi:hypothetical protein